MAPRKTELPQLPDEAVLYAFDIHEDGHGQAVPVEGLAPAPSRGAAYRWIHLNLARPEILPWLKAAIDEVAANSLTLEDTRPRSLAHADGLLINLRGVNLNPGSDHEDMVSIRLFVTDRTIISVRIRKLLAVVAIRETIEAGDAPRTPGHFLARLAGGLTSNMDQVISELSDRVDGLEEESLTDVSGLRRTLIDMRREVIILRRYIAPQRDGLNALPAVGSKLVGEAPAAMLRETVDRVTRIVEELDAIRDRCGVLNDQITDRRAEQMNDRLMVLSVVTAIFLPLGFLTGLFGINIGGMPGTESPLSFWIFAAILTVLAIGQLWWFRKNKWF